MNGVIYNIQHDCLSDGPGIRSVVFFKGCHLRCRWCQNPESLAPRPQLSFSAAACISCGRCRNACPQHAILPTKPTQIDWQKCTNCGSCTTVCPANALEMIGKTMSVEQVINEIRPYSAIYKRSGGGVTLSGGEATLQFEFLLLLVQALKAEKFHIVLETAGKLAWDKFEQLLPFIDQCYFDIKGINPARHLANTGTSNEMILKNAQKLQEHHGNIVYRIPLVPGLNDHVEDLQELDAFLTQLQAKEVHILTWHRFGEDKLKRITSQQQLLTVEIADTSTITNYVEALKKTGRLVKTQ